MEYLGRLIERTVHVSNRKKRDGTQESYLRDDADLSHDHGRSRFIDRDGQFYQSEGEIFVKRKVLIEDVLGLFYAGDPVLFLVNMKTINCCLTLLCIYILWTIIMAVPWLLLGRSDYYFNECYVDTNNFAKAYVFSLEIMMTIGFGALDIYFGSCALPIIVLTVSSCVSLALQAAVLGVLYQRISRNRSRRKTVVMSNKAVFRRIRGKLYFMFQVCELRKRQLVEANVRIYAIKYETLPPELGGSSGSVYCQTYAMRLCHPNDDLGSKLLLATPQIIVHEVDDHSPILPPPEWSPSFYQSHASAVLSRDHDKRQISLFGLEFRTKTPFLSNPLLPEENENSTEMPPNPPSNPTPNDNHVPPLARRSKYSFPNIIQRKAHTFSPSYVNAPVSLEESRESIHPERSFLEEQKEIMRYMEDSRMEIAVILEGVDPLTSHTVQAFHSYTAEDIEWNHFFAPCTFLDYDGWTLVDFVKFHNLIPVPADADRVCSPSHC